MAEEVSGADPVDVREVQHEWAMLPLSSSTTAGGACNQVRFVQLSSGSAVLRIYKNSGDERRVAFEHAVLELAARGTIPFCLPQAIPSASGEPFVRLKSGAHACVFRFIPGRAAPLTAGAAHAIGGAAARLMQALAAVPVRDVMEAAKLTECAAPGSLPNPPFQLLWHAHAVFAGARDAVLAAMARIESSLASAASRDLAFLREEALAMATRLSEDPGGLFAALPQQLIHADLHAGNVLVEPLDRGVMDAKPSAEAAASNGTETGAARAAHTPSSDQWRVTGVLDWEFATVDWRALDPAIALSKFLPEPEEQRWALLRAWMEGFAVAGGELTATEARVFPDLLVLRHLVGFIYFLGNDPSGAAAVSRVQSYADRIRWIQESAEELRVLASRAVTAPPAP